MSEFFATRPRTLAPFSDRRTAEFEICAHLRRCQVASTSADRIFTTYRLYNLFRYEEAVSSQSAANKICQATAEGLRRAAGRARRAFVPAPPEVAALHLKETLNKKGVRVPGATFCGVKFKFHHPSRRCTRRFRALLRWKGAKEEDLQLIESGAVHADVATDEGAMAFRQSAAHRLVATGRGRRSSRPAPGGHEDPGEGGTGAASGEPTPPSRGPARAQVASRRRGQGPVQAVRQPRLAADAAGLRGVDGPRRPRRGPAPLPARRAHAAARRQRGVAARRHRPGAHQGDEDGRRRPVPDARGHPPGRLRGQRRDDDQTRPRDVGRRDAALVPRRDDGQLLCEPRVHAIDAAPTPLDSPRRRGRRVPRHASASPRKARRVALAGHAHAQGPVGNCPIQRPGPQTRSGSVRRRPALLALRHRRLGVEINQDSGIPSPTSRRSSWGSTRRSRGSR